MAMNMPSRRKQPLEVVAERLNQIIADVRCPIHGDMAILVLQPNGDGWSIKDRCCSVIAHELRRKLERAGYVIPIDEPAEP